MNDRFLKDIQPEHGAIVAVKICRTDGSYEDADPKKAVSDVYKTGEKIIVKHSNGKCFLYRPGMVKVAQNKSQVADLRAIMG